jgi:uncharacterized protein (DUF1697 family)
MADLKHCLESAGFLDVKTILSSGNAAFTSRSRSVADIENKIETAMAGRLGRSFYTIVRSSVELQSMIAADPYATFDVPSNAKRVVTFARELVKPGRLPTEVDGARILAVGDRTAFTAYVAGPRGPVFMKLIETTFGSHVTTRTWETVKRCAKA